MRLWERDREVAELHALATQARAGRGATVLVEGEAGIGKTSVLDAFSVAVAADDVTVLRAAGGELEQQIAFGVVRELLGPLASGPTASQLLTGAAALAQPVFSADPSAGESGAAATILHGLYWLVVNACEERPVVLLIDDVQWADTASSRFLLSYLARRIEDVPCLIVAAGRPGWRVSGPPDLPPAARLLRLPPLGGVGVERIVSRTLGQDVDPGFASACLSATGGNPFLTEALAAELAGRGVRGGESDAAQVHAVGPREVAESLRRRLAAHGPAAVALARSVAVLGPSATYRRVGELAEIELSDADAVLAPLVADGVLTDTRPLAFTHPILRTAVHDELTDGARGRWHARAAALLAGDGDEEEAAHHLLLAEPLGDARAVGVLRRAAARAAARGVPDLAVSHLERALAEPPSASERAEVLHDLGAAEFDAGLLVAAVEHFGQALEAATDPVVRDRMLYALGLSLHWSGHSPEAVGIWDRAIDQARSAPVAEAMLTDLLLAATAHSSSRELGGPRLVAALGRDDLRDDERRLMAVMACELAVTCGPAPVARDLGRRAIRDDLLLREEGLMAGAHLMAGLTGVITGDPELAYDTFDAAIAYARERGSAPSLTRALTMRGWAHLSFGALSDAEGDLRVILELPDQQEVNRFLHGAMVGTLVSVTLARAGVDAARAVLAVHDFAEDVGSSPDQQMALARARVALAGDDPAAALAALESSQAFELAFGGATPSYVPWRPIAVTAHLALGDRDRARELAAEHHAQAVVYDAPAVVGVALQTQGLVEGDPQLLEAAVAELARSPARLAHAQALVDLGATLHAGGSRVAAREPLRAGLDLAAVCGAQPLAERAREQLVAAGGRPRRARLTGSDALTPMEQHIVRMAGRGLTNREIAEASFLSPRTVEMHLSNSYRKLGVRGRDQLPELAER